MIKNEIKSSFMNFAPMLGFFFLSQYFEALSANQFFCFFEEPI